MGVEIDKNKNYGSIEDMIDHLYKVAINPEHPDCVEAQEILEEMSARIGFPFSFPRPKSTWCMS